MGSLFDSFKYESGGATTLASSVCFFSIIAKIEELFRSSLIHTTENFGENWKSKKYA